MQTSTDKNVITYQPPHQEEQVRAAPEAQQPYKVMVNGEVYRPMAEYYQTIRDDMTSPYSLVPKSPT